LEAEKDLAAKVVATEDRTTVKLASESSFILAIYQDEDGKLSVAVFGVIIAILYRGRDGHDEAALRSRCC
jgi:hypothetical protein